MAMTGTLFDKISPKDVKKNPYPYVSINKALDADYCDALIAKYPPLSLLAGENARNNNFRFNYGTKAALQNNEIDPLWVEFVKNHSSQQFFNTFVDLFETELTSRYAHIGRTGQDWKNLKLGIRHLNNFSTHDILIDVQIAGNTPVQKVSSVRKRHIDDPRKLFGGLYYLRLDTDTSLGGDLEISQPKTPNFKFYNNVYVEDKYANVTEVIPYKKNTFVLFLNTLESWHGVTPRQLTESPRLFINFIAEFKDPIFDISAQQDKWDLLLKKLRLRKYAKYE